MKNICLPVLMIFLLINMPLLSQNKPELYSCASVQKLDSLFTILARDKTFNGNVLVAENGEVVYSRSIGYADFEKRKSHTGSSAFQLASVSKIFTTVAVLQLAECGRLNTEEHFIKYFPDFPYPEITIYQLLTHTSGIPDKEELFFPVLEQRPDTIFNIRDIIPAMKSLNKPLAFKPGSQWRYNNMGYGLLALLVEKISRKSFGVYLDQHIFSPAGMKSSYLLYSGQKSPFEARGYLIRTHYRGDVEAVDSSRKLHPWIRRLGGFVGCSNIVSTTDDLLKFSIALNNGKLLKPSSVAGMFEPTDLSDGTPVFMDGEFGKTGYGTGWFISGDAGAFDIVMHTGKEPGFFSFFLFDLHRGLTIILLNNMESPGFGKACRESYNILTDSNYFPEKRGKKSLFQAYIKTLYFEGTDKAGAFLNVTKSDTANYYASEQELNEMGLELLNDNQNEAALEALKLCTVLYPDSWNTYDSYGKALLLNGRKKEAIMMYRKSVEMNPKNEPGIKILEQLTK